MMDVVVDASAVVEYLLGSELGVAASSTMERANTELHTPALCDIEVVSAMRGLVASRQVTFERASQAVTDYVDLPLTRHEHLGLLGRVLELRNNFSVYDATYLALAESLGASLLSCDEPLIRGVKRHLPKLALAG